MKGRKRDSEIRIIGIPLDANPDEDSVEVKRRAVLQFLPDKKISFSKNLYSIFTKRLNKKYRVKKEVVKVPDWLLPLPSVEALPLLNSANRIEFIKRGGLKKVAEEVERKILSDEKSGIPFLLSEEHCMTYGALKAIKKTHGDFWFICFDAHIDAISIPARSGMKEDGFCSTNFILKAIEDEILKPEKVVIAGVAERFRKGTPPFREVMELEKKGVKILSRRGLMKEEGFKFLRGNPCMVYVSFDGDVCAGEKTCAVRTRNMEGIPPQKFSSLVVKFARRLRKMKKEICGIDLCEIDALVADAEEDMTLSFWVEVMENFIDEAL